MKRTFLFLSRPILLAVLWLPLAAFSLNLLDMSDKLDQSDRQDFSAAVDKAKRCTQSRDFACAEKALEKAGKFITGNADRKALAAARQDMADAKQRVEDERLARVAAERERQRASSSSYSGGGVERGGGFSLWPNAPKNEGNYNTWQASCGDGGYAWVNVKHNEPNVYCWGAGGFSGARGGCDANIGIEASLRKACGGE